MTNPAALQRVTGESLIRSRNNPHKNPFNHCFGFTKKSLPQALPVHCGRDWWTLVELLSISLRQRVTPKLAEKNSAWESNDLLPHLSMQPCYSVSPTSEVPAGWCKITVIGRDFATTTILRSGHFSPAGFRAESRYWSSFVRTAGEKARNRSTRNLISSWTYTGLNIILMRLPL
jgi:hypothetical protein